MQNDHSKQGEENNWAALRAPGIFILLISSGAAYYFVVQPLMDMLNGKDAISYSTAGIVMTTLGLLFGALYTVLGRNNFDHLLGSPKEKGAEARAIIFIVMILVIALGCFWAWTSLVNTLGYAGAI
jgi:hypothetical protein